VYWNAKVASLNAHDWKKGMIVLTNTITPSTKHWPEKKRKRIRTTTPHRVQPTRPARRLVQSVPEMCSLIHW